MSEYINQITASELLDMTQAEFDTITQAGEDHIISQARDRGCRCNADITGADCMCFEF